MSLLMLVFLLLSGGAGSAAESIEPGVKPLGAYPFVLPGVATSPAASRKILLWCHGLRLVGAVVADEGREKGGGVSQGRPRPKAYLLRDGRCGAEGNVSFGFLVPLKAWVFESPGRGLEERASWLLYRFEGAMQSGRLKGVLVQVNVSHPGYQFRPHSIEVAALAEEQASFADESTWRDSLARAFSVAESEP